MSDTIKRKPIQDLLESIQKEFREMQNKLNNAEHNGESEKMDRYSTIASELGLFSDRLVVALEKAKIE